MFIKQLQSKIQTRSVSNVSGHSNLRYSGIVTPQCNTINAIWDINQIGQELECNDDPILNEALNLINNHQVNQAILILNQMVSDGKKYLGQQSQVQLVMKVTLLVVSSAMSILENDPASALLLLLGCDQMFKGLTPKQQGYLRVQILNGLGCYYRRVGQLEKALKELECALAVIKKCSLKEVAVTHLNLSVVLSLVEEHEGALENAKKAVTESHKEYQYYIKNHISMQAFKFQRCVSSLAISFYNVGVQEQYFQKYQFALQAYASAFKVAEDNLGIHHYLTIQLKNIYEEFARQLAIAEGQKIAITSLNHKFQIRANVTSQYAQSALRNQPQDTVKNVTERLFQSETKGLGHSLRPQSAIMNQTQAPKLKSFDFTKREGHTFRKQLSATNRTLNEDNTKIEVEKLDKTKSLQQCIQNLQSQAQKEQDELKRIQEEKQKELQKLEAFRYINQQIRQQKLQKNSNQTSREMKSSIDQMKQIFNTDPQIQEILDESEPQPLVAIQQQSRITKTEVEEEQNQLNNQINNNDQNLKQDLNKEEKRMSFTTTLEQKGFQDETIQSFTRKLEYEQDSSIKNNYFQQNMSCKQIEDLEEITEEINEVNQQQNIENQVDTIIQQKAKQLEEQQILQKICYIQKYWKYSLIKFNQRIQNLQSKYLIVTDKQYYNIIDEKNNLHNGILFLGFNQSEINYIDIIFIDFYTLRKSQRKCSNINEILQHILILPLSCTITINKDILDNVENKLLSIIHINQQQLIIQSNLLDIEIKLIDKQISLRFDINQLKLYEYIHKLEESIQNLQLPTTIADIQSFNTDSIVVQKSAQINQELNQQPFQEIPLIEEQVLEQINIQKQMSEGNIKQEQQSGDQDIQFSESQQESKNGSDEIDKINKTGQFNINVSSSQKLQSQQDLDKIDEDNEDSKQQQQQIQTKESNQNLDFTLQYNEYNMNNSMIDTMKINEPDNYQQLENKNKDKDKDKDKPSINQTILEEDEEDQKELEQNVNINKQEKEYQRESSSLYSNSDYEIESKQNQDQQNQQNSQTFPEEKSQINQVSFKEHKNYSKQTSLQMPDLIKENIDSDQEMSLTKPYQYEFIGTITGINKINGVLILINIFINKEQQLFQAKAEIDDIKIKPTYFKVENVEKTIKKLQKYLKGYLVNWKNQIVLKVYTKQHEKAVLKLQKKFKFDHYRRLINFKLAKTNIEGGLYVGSRKQVIYLAIETKTTQQRNSYTFKNENYSQFVNKISFRVLNNLKYSEDQGIYLLQEPQHRILAQNLQAKIFKLLKPQHTFEFIGFGLLNGIYDSVHKKIIIASDNRKTQSAQVDIPKSIQGDQIISFSQNLLNRSFIIQSNNENCVIYYEQKDENYVKYIQNTIFQFQTIRNINIDYYHIYKGQIRKQDIKIELQRKIKRIFCLKYQEKIYIIGKLNDKEIKNLIQNLKKIICTFLIQENNQIEIDINSLKEFTNQEGHFVQLLRMDLKDFVYQI